jgi:thioredoxin 1
MSSFKKIISQDKPVLVDFTASWCGPCKAMAPILDQVKNEVGDNASIIKIDVDRNQQIAQSLQIQGVPTLILYKNGKQLWRQSGVVQKEMLVNLLNQHS